MAPRYDFVVEAVRYSLDGQIALLRGYQRIDSTYTDRRLISRQQALEMLRAGKKLAAGMRRVYLASTFDISSPIVSKGDWIITEGAPSGRDLLRGVPVF